jgi:hypothetical protein
MMPFFSGRLINIVVHYHFSAIERFVDYHFSSTVQMKKR